MSQWPGRAFCNHLYKKLVILESSQVWEPLRDRKNSNKRSLASSSHSRSQEGDFWELRDSSPSSRHPPSGSLKTQASSAQCLLLCILLLGVVVLTSDFSEFWVPPPTPPHPHNVLVVHCESSFINFWGVNLYICSVLEIVIIQGGAKVGLQGSVSVCRAQGCH